MGDRKTFQLTIRNTGKFQFRYIIELITPEMREKMKLRKLKHGVKSIPIITDDPDSSRISVKKKKGPRSPRSKKEPRSASQQRRKDKKSP